MKISVADEIGNFFLARQSILDENLKIYAYELFYRSENSFTNASFADDLSATATVIVNALGEFGLNNLTQDYRCFINVSSSILVSEAIEIIPSEKVILEITEHTIIDDAIINRCKALKAMGFELSINKFTYNPSYDQLLPLLDYIKINASLMLPEQISTETETIKMHSDAILIAEGIEIVSDFNICKLHGFSYFQGYYFDRPYLFHICNPTTQYWALVSLLDRLMNDIDLDELVKDLENNLALSLCIYRLIMSRTPAKSVNTHSLRETLLAVGKEDLTKWIQLLLLARKPKHLRKFIF